ncbi:MAG: phosphoribosylformylglycinamidine synthase subunit PurS [Deltaproteobacteria bacterium]|nr:phosphoribosylformylglycinamidine synthase subunit PurS [Deltaproteobacteria bacterium]
MLAKIYVTLKNGVLDPQGKAVQRSLESIGYKEAEDVRIGKFIEVRLSDMPKTEAEKKVKEMCEKMLANTVIENYRFEIL